MGGGTVHRVHEERHNKLEAPQTNEDGAEASGTLTHDTTSECCSHYFSRIVTDQHDGNLFQATESGTHEMPFKSSSFLFFFDGADVSFEMIAHCFRGTNCAQL